MDTLFPLRFAKRLAGLVGCAALLVTVPCAQAAQPSAITVSGAASLTGAFTDIKTAFEKAHPTITVHTNFAASNPLLKQMEEGAPVDVFASADQETMDKAQAKKLIDPKTRANFAQNDLVMIVPADKPALTTPDALLAPHVKHIALGKPESVPAGRYTQEALTTAGLWDKLQAKYVFGASVRQALDYVNRGEVDAGFVYRTDALAAGKKVAITATIGGHKPVTYPIAIATTGSNAKDAALFTAFVLAPE
ncbi:MAG: molybdate ABC transporter substrate-binding protein, partial [Bilophila sp.]